MATRLVRGAAAVVLVATAALLNGCGGGGGSTPAKLSGDWTGSLSLGYSGGGGASGSLKMTLDEQESFVSGIATWAPYGTTQSIEGPIDGDAVSLNLMFRCNDNREAATLTGTFDGTRLTITGGSGTACAEGAAASAVTSASGSLTRTTDNAPL
jgi:hypothetical protein